VLLLCLLLMLLRRLLRLLRLLLLRVCVGRVHHCPGFFERHALPPRRSVG
jgi:hypothetical protein